MASEILENPQLIIEQLREEQEQNQQFIHEYKRKIESLEILEKEYQEEIERLNEDKVHLEYKFRTKIQEEKCLLINSNNEEIQILQKELAELHLENNELKIQSNLNKKFKTSISKTDQEDNTEILKVQILELEDTVKDLSVKLNLSQKQCSDLEEMNEILKNENEGLQENINLKKEELEEANELIKDLQDNIMCLKMELDSIKHKPLDENSRGNSLFAEVNDSRVQLVKKMKNLIAKYTEVSRDRERLLEENKSLRVKNTTMIELIQKDIEEYRPGNRTEIEAHKSTIDGLRKLIENYKEEIKSLKKKDNPEPSKDLKYYEYSLKCREKEIESLRQTLDTHSTSHILKARNLCQLGQEMVSWKCKASELENQVQILTNKIHQLEGDYDKELKELPETDENPENHNNEKVTSIITINNKHSHVSNKKLQKCTVIDENFDSCKDESVTSISTNNSKHSLPMKISTRENIYLEKPVRKEKTIETNKNEAIIDLTSESDEKVQKSVHFNDDTKEESKHVNLRKGPAVIVTPLPITCYRKK